MAPSPFVACAHCHCIVLSDKMPLHLEWHVRLGDTAVRPPGVLVQPGQSTPSNSYSTAQMLASQQPQDFK